MKRASVVLAALLLGACAPTANNVSTAPLDPYGGGLKPIRTPPVIWFSAGTIDLFDLVVTIYGSNLRANDIEHCKVDGMAIKCTVPALPAGQNFVLPMKGSNISAVATYKRSNGQSYSSIVRQ